MCFFWNLAVYRQPGLMIPNVGGYSFSWHVLACEIISFPSKREKQEKKLAYVSVTALEMKLTKTAPRLGNWMMNLRECLHLHSCLQQHVLARKARTKQLVLGWHAWLPRPTELLELSMPRAQARALRLVPGLEDLQMKQPADVRPNFARRIEQNLRTVIRVASSHMDQQT